MYTVHSVSCKNGWFPSNKNNSGINNFEWKIKKIHLQRRADNVHAVAKEQFTTNTPKLLKCMYFMQNY